MELTPQDGPDPSLETERWERENPDLAAAVQRAVEDGSIFSGERSFDDLLQDATTEALPAEALPSGGKPLVGYEDPGPIITDPTIEQRIYAVCRWAAALAVKELVDGTELTLIMRDEGPAPFLPGEAEWDRINDTSKMGINYVLTGDVNG